MFLEKKLSESILNKANKNFKTRIKLKLSIETIYFLSVVYL